MTPNLFVEVIKTHPDSIIPKYQTDGASGMDLHAQVSASLAPMQRLLIPTGLRFLIPHGFEGQIRPRSGIALKDGVTVLNSPGTVDSDYIGEVHVLLINLGDVTVKITAGDRIAQIVFAPVGRAALQVVDRFSTITGRGEGSFGSTGK